MNQITGASQNAASSLPQNLPPESFDRLDRLDNGFSPAIPGQTRAEWLENARTSTNPAMQAYYRELVTLAGGRIDDAALNQVIDRYQALQNATTASEVQAAERGWLDQIGSMLSRFDPINRLLDTAQPHIAGLAREAGLGETAWGASLQRVLDAPGSISAFREGMRAGVLAGAQDLVVGTLGLAGQALQYGADNSLAGRAGDALRGLTGPLPGVLDTMTPSAARGAATSEKLADMGGKIGDYLGAVAADPGRLKTDIINAIDAQWSRLEASHAAAAAKGPQAEARWWGETVGRVTFEVAATFVPVSKVSTVGKVANAAEGVGDLAHAVNRADGAAVAAARAADGAGDVVTAGTRIANRTDAAGDAARAATGPVETPQTPRPRPDFVDGRPQLYFDDAGTKGNWRRELNEALKPNADYHVNGYKFSTDAKGRVVSVEGQLTLAKAERNGYQQAVAGRADRLPDDQGGHLIASIFNGPGEAVNLKAMNGSFNMTEFRNLERTLEDALKAGKTVDVKIDVIHSGDSLRPDKFEVSYVIDGRPKQAIFENKAGG